MSKLKQKYSHLKEDDNSIDNQTDGDIIRCVCDDPDDDGFTIQCESCENWQHASCVNIKKNNIPDRYICDRCSKKRKENSSIRRRNSTEAEKKIKSKKILKRSNPKKRVLDQDSDEEEPSQYHSRLSKKKFIPLSKSIFKEKLVEDLLIEVHRQWMESNRSKASKSKAESSLPSAATAKGLDSIVVMESNLLLPAIPKASVKPLRKSLRGSFLQNQKDPTVEKGVFADIHIPEHRYLMEVTGELTRKSEYKNDAGNNFASLGTPLAHVFFFRAFDICIDARFAGNDTRYIRRSCSPNSEIKSIILPNDSDDQTIHMGIYTSEEIDRGEEITIGWNWHRGLPMWNKNKEFLRKNYTLDISPSEIKSLKQILKLIASEFGECACEDKEECLIECLKDKLERQGDEHNEDEGSSVKKKRIATKPRADTENTKKPKKPTPRPNDIFSSDEDDKKNHRKEERKQTKHVKKTTSTKRVANTPSSPTVSLGDSVDIDILSMSPVPSQPASENESDTQSIGIKRPRPMTGIKLPCKKKWLYDYMIQQQQKQQQQQASSAAQPESKPLAVSPKAPYEGIAQNLQQASDQEDSSDGASSESTLPLDDTPTAHIDIKKQESSPSQIAQPPSIKSEPNSLQPIPESSTTHHSTITEAKTEETKQAPKKLTLQEYLVMRRGNLPTPDERHANTES